MRRSGDTLVSVRSKLLPLIIGVFFLSLVSIFGRLLASVSGYINTLFGYSIVLLFTTLWWGMRYELTNIFPSKKRLDLLFLGLGQLGSAAFFLQAIRFIDLAVAGLLLYSAPLWIVLISLAMKTEHITRRIILPLILGLMGVALVLGPQYAAQSSDIRAGAVLGLCAGVSYAISYIFARRIGGEVGTATIVFWAHAIGVAILIPFLFISPPISNNLSFLWWLGIGLSWTFGYFFLYHALKFIPAHRASIVALFEPVFIVIWGALFFGEAMTVLSFVGGILILAGVYQVNKSTK
ncbi:MAG: DMT family transporter [Candidatus Peregrinibacteria bacterium]